MWSGWLSALKWELSAENIARQSVVAYRKRRGKRPLLRERERVHQCCSCVQAQVICSSADKQLSPEFGAATCLLHQTAYKALLFPFFSFFLSLLKDQTGRKPGEKEKQKDKTINFYRDHYRHLALGFCWKCFNSKSIEGQKSLSVAGPSFHFITMLQSLFNIHFNRFMFPLLPQWRVLSVS